MRTTENLIMLSLVTELADLYILFFCSVRKNKTSNKQQIALKICRYMIIRTFVLIKHCKSKKLLL